MCAFDSSDPVRDVQTSLHHLLILDIEAIGLDSYTCIRAGDVGDMTRRAGVADVLTKK
jgi:hypothetical protein